MAPYESSDEGDWDESDEEEGEGVRGEHKGRCTLPPNATVRCGVDVGGTLIKVAYITNKHEKASEDEEQTSQDTADDQLPTSLALSIDESRSLHFAFFYTRKLQDLICFVRARRLVDPGGVLHVTGGGAFRYQTRLSEALKAKVEKHDEMTTVMKGLSFFVNRHQGILAERRQISSALRPECSDDNTTVAHSTASNDDDAESRCSSGSRADANDEGAGVFRYDIPSKRRVPVKLPGPLYPFLVVNIGSGVSILQALGPGKFKRITGTCIGGGTVLGLARLLWGAESFDEVVRLSESGNESLDLKVKDLLGDSAGSCFDADTLASSFGSLYAGHRRKFEPLTKEVEVKREDVAHSLLSMVSYNLGYLAYLVGSIHFVSRVFFAGKYISNHSITMESITRGVNFYHQHYHYRRSLSPVSLDNRVLTRGAAETDEAFELRKAQRDAEEKQRRLRSQSLRNIPTRLGSCVPLPGIRESSRDVVQTRDTLMSFDMTASLFNPLSDSITPDDDPMGTETRAAMATEEKNSSDDIGRQASQPSFVIPSGMRAQLCRAAGEDFKPFSPTPSPVVSHFREAPFSPVGLQIIESFETLSPPLPPTTVGTNAATSNSPNRFRLDSEDFPPRSQLAAGNSLPPDMSPLFGARASRAARPPQHRVHEFSAKPFEVLFLKHDGYLGAVGTLIEAALGCGPRRRSKRSKEAS